MLVASSGKKINWFDKLIGGYSLDCKNVPQMTLNPSVCLNIIKKTFSFFSLSHVFSYRDPEQDKWYERWMSGLTSKCTAWFICEARFHLFNLQFLSLSLLARLAEVQSCQRRRYERPCDATDAETCTPEKVGNPELDYSADEINDQSLKIAQTTVLHSAAEALIMED